MLRASQTEAKPRVSRDELIKAIESLSGIFSDGQIDQLAPTGPAAVYTTSVTLWMLVMQRFALGSTLNEVVKDFIAARPAFCPDNRRLEEKTLSESSGAYAGARKRLELPTVKFLYEKVLRSFDPKPEPLEFRPRRTFLLDGTTITLEPTKALQRKYPPAKNQHGSTVWPVMMIMVAHSLQTGTAMLPEHGPMYGGKADSEAKLAIAILKRLPRESIIMADAGFGIFRLAYHCELYRHDYLFRLTPARFGSMTKKATLVKNRGKNKVWKLNWHPSAKDRKGCPGIKGDTTLWVWIHEIELNSNGKKLYLVTSLDEDSQSLKDRYYHRYDVETDIKEFKVMLDIENIRAKSVEMVQKELYTSLTAYNLLMGFRRQAALIGGVEPRRLSFTEVLNTYNSFLKYELCELAAEACVERFEQALSIASRCKIPHRPGRSYKRAAHPRRQKTTKEQKAARGKNKSDPEKTTAEMPK